MRNILPTEDAASASLRLLELIRHVGRLRSLRDPLLAVMEETRFTPAQAHALAWLGSDGALSMGELAQRLGITEKTVTGVVDRLEREGYAHRERDDKDRRVVKTHLTRRGAGIARRLQAAVREKLDLFMGALEPEDRAHLLRIMETFVARVEAASPEPLRPVVQPGKRTP